MKRGFMFLVVGVFQVSASTATFAQEKRYSLEAVAGLRLHNVLAEPAVLQSKKGVRLTTLANVAADNGRPEPDYLALLDDVEFSSGTIEAEVAGAPGQGAFEAARGYVGIAFRIQGDMKTYDAFFLRPTNGRAEDQERRNHSTQYVSHPEWTWSRLRSETPSKYESYVDLEAGAWTKIKIEVHGNRARLYVHDQPQPTLVVNDLKSGPNAKGGVALWLGPGTVAHFRRVVVTPSRSPPSETPENRLDSAARGLAVERLARSLEMLYVKPTLGDSLARYLRGRFAARSYDQLSDPRAFANALSRDLDSTAHDLHLWVRYFPPTTNGEQGPDLDETWLNHGYPSVRILDGNVGYLDVRNFLPGPAAVRAMAAAMTLLGDCDALIIDLRNNGGGTTPMMARLASYLFADSVHISDLYWRDLPDTIRVWTQPGSVGIHLSQQPLYAITSRRTFSAAEDFAYALQQTRRATIVGDRTRGGAHSAKGAPQDLGSGLRALVPSGESVGVRSKKNWERIGVLPDLIAADSIAVRLAHRTAVEALIAGAQPGPRRDRLQQALRGLD